MKIIDKDAWAYQSFHLKDFMYKTGIRSFKDKVILEIGSDFSLNVANFFIELGAKEVVCVNPAFPKNLVPSDSRIKLIKNAGENINFPNNYFDVIFGVALIEHVLNIKELFCEVKRMLKFNGVAFLQGNPLYTSPCGHHLWVKCDDIHYKFHDKTNPFEPWEHLCLETNEDISKNLRKKGISEGNIEKIIKFMSSNDISKIPPSKIVSLAKEVPNLWIEYYISKNDYTENEYFELAKNKYCEDDLRAMGISFLIFKHRLFALIGSIRKIFAGVRLIAEIYFS